MRRPCSAARRRAKLRPGHRLPSTVTIITYTNEPHGFGPPTTTRASRASTTGATRASQPPGRIVSATRSPPRSFSPHPVPPPTRSPPAARSHCSSPPTAPPRASSSGHLGLGRGDDAGGLQIPRGDACRLRRRLPPALARVPHPATHGAGRVPITGAAHPGRAGPSCTHPAADVHVARRMSSRTRRSLAPRCETVGRSSSCRSSVRAACACRPTRESLPRLSDRTPALLGVRRAESDHGRLRSHSSPRSPARLPPLRRLQLRPCGAPRACGSG